MIVKRKHTIIAGIILIVLILFTTCLVLRNNYMKHKHPLDLKLWTYNKTEDEYTYECADGTQDLEIKQSVKITDDTIIINVDTKADSDDEKLKVSLKEGKHVNSNIPCPFAQMNIYTLYDARDQGTEYADRDLILNYSVNNTNVLRYKYTKDEVMKALSDSDKIKKDVDAWYSSGITEKEEAAEKRMEDLNKTITDESSIFAE